MLTLPEILNADIFELVKSSKSHEKTSRKRSKFSQTNQEFSRLETSGRIVSSYGGVLPCARLKARHLLRCEHLRELPGERFPPYRVEPHYTHQIWLWYRLKQNPDKLYLLFRGQFDFSIPEQDVDEVAREVTKFLAFLLQEGEQHLDELYRHDNSDLFWARAVERKFKDLQENYG